MRCGIQRFPDQKPVEIPIEKSDCPRRPAAPAPRTEVRRETVEWFEASFGSGRLREGRDASRERRDGDGHEERFEIPPAREAASPDLRCDDSRADSRGTAHSDVQAERRILLD